MIYVALLRGINVGGSSKVDMKTLKATFEDAGMTSVRTYINSGNVIFSTRSRAKAPLARALETAITERFGLDIKVLVLDIEKMRSVVDAIPSRWTNDQTMRCEVLFLWGDVDRPTILKQLPIKPKIDDVRYTSGAFIWRFDRKNATRTGLAKVIGTPLYKQLTMRNSNTARKLLELMER